MHVRKQADTVAWNSLGQDDWTVDFGKDSPLNEGLRIYVPRNGPSRQCTIRADAQARRYPYDVLPDSTEAPKERILAGPVIIVDAGNGNTPPGKGKKRKAARKTRKTAGRKTAGPGTVARKSARQTAASKGARKTAARKTTRAAPRAQAAKKR